jgi:hypothetical protein
VNASYVYGLQLVNAHMRRALGTLTPYDTFVKATQLSLDSDEDGAGDAAYEEDDIGVDSLAIE